jgi:hypothetical protein
MLLAEKRITPKEGVMQQAPTWPLPANEAQLPDDLAELAATILGDGQMATVDSLPARVALLYAVRTARQLVALSHLCRQGYAPEGVGIVRSIAEDAVSLAYLADDPVVRAEQWAQHAEERPAHSAATGGKPDNSPWWSGCGPSKMAEQLRGQHEQIGREFSKLYWRLSDDAHWSPHSASNYVVPAQTGSPLPSMLAGPSNYRVAEVAALAAAGASRVIAVASELGLRVPMDAVTELATTVTALYRTRSSEAP